MFSKRELAEETGLSNVYVNPEPVVRMEREISFNGKKVYLKEEYYVAQTERDVIVSKEQWTVNE
jgi:hypothetical protein